MAMVDSSVGGKTGVNHPLGKNMIGAFYQPQCVLADMETLKSLPDRELASGISEIVKYGLIHDPELFQWLEDNVDKLLARDSKVTTSLGELLSCGFCLVAHGEEATQRVASAALEHRASGPHVCMRGLGAVLCLHGKDTILPSEIHSSFFELMDLARLRDDIARRLDALAPDGTHFRQDY